MVITKSHKHQVYSNTTCDRTNSSLLLMTFYQICQQSQQNGCKSSTKCSQRPLQSWNWLDCGLHYGITLVWTKTNTLTFICHDTSKINSKIWSHFERTTSRYPKPSSYQEVWQSCPRSHPRIPRNYPKTKENKSIRVLETYFTLHRLSTSHSSWP